MLGRLQRDAHPGPLAKLPGPHARAVHDELAFDIALVGGDGRDASALHDHPGCGHPLDDLDPLHAGALCHRHRDVDRIHSSVAGDIEPGLEIVSPGEGEEFGDLLRRDLMDVDAKDPVERRDPPVLLKSCLISRGLDESNRAESGGEAGLSLEAAIQVAAVHPH